MEGCQHPHDDPLVTTVVVANKTVHRVLVDNGSSADIIFTSAFDKMGIGREKLETVKAHLRGFLRERVLPLGSIQLVLTDSCHNRVIRNQQNLYPKFPPTAVVKLLQ